MRNHAIAVLGLLLAACAATGGYVPASDLEPRFDPAARHPVIQQRHSTGTVAPQYFHDEVLVIQGDGRWTATRTYPYVEPPRSEAIGSGSLSPAQLQDLVDGAFARAATDDARFVDLPADVDGRAIGGGRREITLWVDKGSHSVSVNGPMPAAFRRFDDAIASATVPLMP